MRWEVRLEEFGLKGDHADYIEEEVKLVTQYKLSEVC